jgi:hypothetical protein
LIASKAKRLHPTIFAAHLPARGVQYKLYVFCRP